MFSVCLSKAERKRRHVFFIHGGGGEKVSWFHLDLFSFASYTLTAQWCAIFTHRDTHTLSHTQKHRATILSHQETFLQWRLVCLESTIPSYLTHIDFSSMQWEYYWLGEKDRGRNGKEAAAYSDVSDSDCDCETPCTLSSNNKQLQLYCCRTVTRTIMESKGEHIVTTYRQDTLSLVILSKEKGKCPVSVE